MLYKLIIYFLFFLKSYLLKENKYFFSYAHGKGNIRINETKKDREPTASAYFLGGIRVPYLSHGSFNEVFFTIVVICCLKQASFPIKMSYFSADIIHS